MEEQQKWHRGLSGAPAECHATERPCPRGGQTEHGSKEQMEIYCDNFNHALYSMREEELKEKAMDNSPQGDFYRTVLYERLNSEKTPIKKSLNEIKYSDFAEPDSGLSLDVNKKELVQGGFCVSPYPEHSLAINGDLSEDDFQKTINNYQKEHKDVLKKKNHILGFWKSPYDGNLYVDISVVVDNASYAREVGEMNDQQGYFDLQQFEEFTINENATSGQ